MTNPPFWVCRESALRLTALLNSLTVPRPYRKHIGHRVPPTIDGVQFNRCYTPWCENFAVEPSGVDGRSDSQHRDGYTVTGSTKAGRRWTFLQCRNCGGVITMLSNAGAVEELARFGTAPEVVGCRTGGCAHTGLSPSQHPAAYQRFGCTDAGARRFRCRACQRTFSVNANPTHRLRRPEKTEEVLRLLVNKVPMRRLCDVADVRPAVLYQRIGLLYERLRAFAREHESQFQGTAALERLRVGIDRQDHPLTWGSTLERQTFPLRAIATAETDSGYVLGQHVNYDPDENALARELEARALGDPARLPPFRRAARLWLPFEAETGTVTTRASDAPAQARSADAGALGLAGRGAFVHETYTLLGHFLFLRPWFARAVHVHVSMDQENAIDRACLLTFPDRVLEGSLDAFYVRINKGLSVPRRRLEIARLETVLAEHRARDPERSEREILQQLLTERYRAAVANQPDPYKRWVAHPYASMQEPNREVLCVTPLSNRTEARMVSGLSRATLRAVDRYFMQVRRKISVLERPIRTSSTAWRAWQGYSAYSPRVVMQVLEIFRVVYNFHLVGQDRRTPAERLGVADRRIPLGDLIRGDLPSRAPSAGSRA